MYEDTANRTYAEDVWVDLTGIRELVEADDAGMIEIAFRVTGTPALWEVFEISADLIRLTDFNVSSNTASPGFRFKTGRSETVLSGFGHSMAFLSRRTATTWRVGQSHIWFDRVRIEFCQPLGGTAAGRHGVVQSGTYASGTITLNRTIGET